MKATIQKIAGKLVIGIEPETFDELKGMRGMDIGCRFEVVSTESHSTGDVVGGGVILLEVSVTE